MMSGSNFNLKEEEGFDLLFISAATWDYANLLLHSRFVLKLTPRLSDDPSFSLALSMRFIVLRLVCFF